MRLSLLDYDRTGSCVSIPGLNRELKQRNGVRSYACQEAKSPGRAQWEFRLVDRRGGVSERVLDIIDRQLRVSGDVSPVDMPSATTPATVAPGVRRTTSLELAGLVGHPMTAYHLQRAQTGARAEESGYGRRRYYA